mmetsp:Transcript_113459/g.327646  ORF Transcript_113459/g.327646 Transcript_113459/m.327646 type:complete len:840 (-) Transcript_113459:29-2548(-)
MVSAMYSGVGGYGGGGGMSEEDHERPANESGSSRVVRLDSMSPRARPVMIPRLSGTGRSITKPRPSPGCRPSSAKDEKDQQETPVVHSRVIGLNAQMGQGVRRLDALKCHMDQISFKSDSTPTFVSSGACQSSRACLGDEANLSAQPLAAHGADEYCERTAHCDLDGFAARLEMRMDMLEQNLTSLCEGWQQREQARANDCVGQWEACRDMLSKLVEAPGCTCGMDTRDFLQSLAPEVRRLFGRKAGTEKPIMVRTQSQMATPQAKSEAALSGIEEHYPTEQRPTLPRQNSLARGFSGTTTVQEEATVNSTRTSRVTQRTTLVAQQSTVEVAIEDNQPTTVEQMWSAAGDKNDDNEDSKNGAASEDGESSADSSIIDAKMRGSIQDTGRCKDRLKAWAIDILGAPSPDSHIRALAQSYWFGLISVAISLANGIAIAIDADTAVGNAVGLATTGDAPTLGAQDDVRLVVVQRLFLVWLAIEFIVQLLGRRADYFFGSGRYWNYFDLFVLVASLCTTVGTANVPTSHLRILRIARSMRAVQALRFVRYFESLQRMTARVSYVTLTLFWAGCLMFMLIYIVGIVMMEGVTAMLYDAVAYPPSDDWRTSSSYSLSTPLSGPGEFGFLQAVHGYYGSAWRTWVTLFRGISGGDWSTFAAPLASGNWVWCTVWILYIFCVVFGLLNIITAVLVDLVKRPLPLDRELELAALSREERKLQEMFSTELKRAGQGEDGEMTKKMFNRFVHDEVVTKRLKAVGIDIGRLEDAYHLVDPEDNGSVTAKMAARQLLQLRGLARSVDVMRIAREVGKLRHGLHGLAVTTYEIRDTIKDAFDTPPEFEEVAAI